MVATTSANYKSELQPSAVEGILQRAQQCLGSSELTGPKHQIHASADKIKLACLRTDSRAVQPGDIFLAYRGVSSDGHRHIAAAVAKGAALLIVEEPQLIPDSIRTPWIQCRSGRAAWSILAAHAFGNPQESMTMLGITGTNGKTSTAWMVGQLLQAVCHPCIVIGTLGAYINGEHVPTGHTTPDPDLLYGLLSTAKARGITTCVMEVSSHAIVQEKLLPIRYSGCAFTSFSRDHLDFHNTMAEYLAAKLRLFTELSAPNARFAIHSSVLEQLDERVRFSVAAQQEAFSYGIRSPNADAVATLGPSAQHFGVQIVNTGFDGSQLKLQLGPLESKQFSGRVPYFADHAINNFAAALLLTAKVCGDFVKPSLWANLAAVPGRLERVSGPKSPGVIVDYAHTPDALEKTLQVLRPFCKGRLMVVFGCGGDRDQGKRPVMGKIAEQLSDRLYITSDNPRSERPESILNDIASGLTDATSAVLEIDRAKAIKQAIADARSDDIVLVAGKGHETYQILHDRTIAFDDRMVAKAALQTT